MSLGSPSLRLRGWGCLGYVMFLSTTPSCILGRDLVTAEIQKCPLHLPCTCQPQRTRGLLTVHQHSPSACILESVLNTGERQSDVVLSFLPQAQGLSFDLWLCAPRQATVSFCLCKVKPTARARVEIWNYSRRHQPYTWHIDDFRSYGYRVWVTRRDLS